MLWEIHLMQKDELADVFESFLDIDSQFNQQRCGLPLEQPEPPPIVNIT